MALMQGYGVLLACFHDIGMIDFSGFGRQMHPEFAAQAVFDPELDDLIAAIWFENSGGVAWHLQTLYDKGLIKNPKLVLREMLALSVCHSKNKVPVALLNDPVLLRARLMEVVTTDLRSLYALQQQRKGRQGNDNGAEADVELRPNPGIGRFANHFPDEAFCWLVDPSPECQALVEDVIDTCRVLRAADALRQRGTVLETSGGYQIFVDQRHGCAVYAFRLGQKQHYMLEMDEPISAGEANIASSALEHSGDLRISFHRGYFSAEGAQKFAAHGAALIVNDVQQDVIESFNRSKNGLGLKKASEMLILLEETEDDVSFTQMVQKELATLDFAVGERVRLTPSLKNVCDQERERYLAAKPLTWGLPARRELIGRMAEAGYPCERFDLAHAFRDVRLAALEAGDVLVQAHAPAHFVYVPLGLGLTIIPLSGHDSFSVQPWMPLGMTGVVRGSERNATIVAERALQVLMIPKTTYLTYWHHTFGLEEFQAVIAEAVAAGPIQKGAFSELEKSLLLHAVPLFKSLDQETLLELAASVSEVQVAAGEMVIEKGSVGRSLFVVADGALQAHDGSLILTQLGPGDFFGEMAALTPEPRMVNVSAATDSSLLRLDQKVLYELVDSNSEVAKGIIRELAGFVRERTADLVQLRDQLDK